MQKESHPKFFSFDIINIIITIVSFIAVFSFWTKWDDKERLIYIVVPCVIIILIVNLIKYYIQVKKLYKKYEELYNNNEALALNYKDNVKELKQAQYNNEVLRDFANKTINILMVYNDMTKEERNILRKELISNFIKGNIEEGENNDQSI